MGQSPRARQLPHLSKSVPTGGSRSARPHRLQPSAEWRRGASCREVTPPRRRRSQRQRRGSAGDATRCREMTPQRNSRRHVAGIESMNPATGHDSTHPQGHGRPGESGQRTRWARSTIQTESTPRNRRRSQRRLTTSALAARSPVLAGASNPVTEPTLPSRESSPARAGEKSRPRVSAWPAGSRRWTAASKCRVAMP